MNYDGSTKFISQKLVLRPLISWHVVPPCLMVSAGLWLPSLLLAEPGEDSVTCRRPGAADADAAARGDAGRYRPPLTDERTWNGNEMFYSFSKTQRRVTVHFHTKCWINLVIPVSKILLKYLESFRGASSINLSFSINQIMSCRYLMSKTYKYA